MSTKSIFPSKLSSSHNITQLPRIHPLIFNPICNIPIPNHRDGWSSFSALQTTQRNMEIKRNLVVYCNPPPAGGSPLIPDSWKGWLLGILATVVIPLLTNKWGALMKWTNRIESAVQQVENIVEAVEGVAEKVEKISEDVIEELPEGKLKKVVSGIEHAAEEIAKDAGNVDKMIDKFQEVEEQVDTYIKDKNGTTKKAKDQEEIKET